MDTTQRALFEELAKIGEAAEAKTEKKPDKYRRAKRVGGALAASALGAGAGAGAAQLVERGWPRFMGAQRPIPAGRIKQMKWGLPIAGMGVGMLGSIYRQRMKDELSGK